MCIINMSLATIMRRFGDGSRDVINSETKWNRAKAFDTSDTAQLLIVVPGITESFRWQRIVTLESLHDTTTGESRW